MQQNPVLVRRICSFCGHSYLVKRTDSRTCSTTCRLRLSRWRKKLPRTALQAEQAITGVGAYLKFDDSRELALSHLIELQRSIVKILIENGIRPQAVR